MFKALKVYWMHPERVRKSKEISPTRVLSSNNTMEKKAPRSNINFFLHLIILKWENYLSIHGMHRLQLNYSWLKDQIPEEALKEFHKRICEIPTLSHIQPIFQNIHP